MLGVQRSYKPVNLPVIKLLLLAVKETDTVAFITRRRTKAKIGSIYKFFAFMCMWLFRCSIESFVCSVGLQRIFIVELFN